MNEKEIIQGLLDIIEKITFTDEDGTMVDAYEDDADLREYADMSAIDEAKDYLKNH